MTKQDILELVAKTLKQSPTDCIAGTKTEHVHARYIVLTLLIEEGFANWEVMEFLDIHRTAIYYILDQVDVRLQTNQIFKSKYLACVGALTEIEDWGPPLW